MQHDYNLINQSGASFRADLNNALGAIVSNNSGSSEPSTMFAYEFWIDETTGKMKLRNSANNAWITMPFNIGVNNSVDINVGTINGITSFSFNSGATVGSILDEDNFNSNSATALATQQSIKSYVDAQVTAADLDITDGSSVIAIDLDSETLSLLGGTGVTSSASGNGVTFAIGQAVGSSDNVVFNQVTAAVIGNASSSTILQNARTISGISFNGSANITLNTSTIVENTNLYYTQARFNTAFSGKSTTNLAEGNKLFYTQARFDTAFAGKSTTNLTEGNKLFFTVERVDDRVAAFIQTGVGISWNYNDGAGTLTPTITLAPFNTSQLSESGNLYYTNARANAAIDSKVNKSFVDSLNIAAATANTLANARSISLSGDVVGSVSFNGGSDVSISTVIQANSVALGNDTVGDYVKTITGTANKIEVTGSGTESRDVALSLPSDVQIANNLVVANNLTVNGTLTTLNTTNLAIEDNLFELNAGLTGTPVNDSGMFINRGNQNNAVLFWDESADKFTLGLTTANGSATGNITLASLGSLVANIEGQVIGNVTGQVSSISNFTTANLTENTNLYFTNTRANAAIDSKVNKSFVDALNIVAATTTGLSGSATILQNSRLIGGVAFNGSADIVPTTFADGTFSSTLDVLGVTKLKVGGVAKLTTRTAGILVGGEVEANTLDITGVATIDGNTTIGGTLGVTGRVTSAGITTTTGSVFEGGIEIGQTGTGTDAVVAAFTATNGNNVATFRSTDSGHGFKIQSQNSGYLSFNSGANLTIDAVGDIILDADGGDWKFKDGGTEIGLFTNDSSDFVIESRVQDKDLIFKGQDASSTITALTLDMSAAGAATFNSSITIPDYIYHTSDANTYFGFPGGDQFDLVTGAASRIKIVGSETVFNESGVDKNFRVESNGNANMLFVDGGTNRVAIGKSDPARTLDVHGSVEFSVNTASHETFIFTTQALNDAKLLMQNASAATAIQLSANGTTHFNGGNVGIGTTSPTGTYGKLTVAGGIRTLNDSESKLELGRYSSGAANSYIKLGANSASLKITNNNDSADIFTIENGGNVGIGTNNPTGSGTVLHVNGSSTVADFHLTNSTSGSASTDGFVLRYSGLNAEFLNREAGSNIFYTAGTERVRIDATGKTTFKNEIDLSTGSNKKISWRDADDTFRAGIQAVTTGGQMIGTSSANDFAIRSQSNMLFSTGGNTERIRIGSDGGVGIGIANQSGVRLYVDAPANTHASVFRNDTRNFAPIVVDNQATSGTRQLISFRLNNTEIGKITSTGSTTNYGVNSDYRLKENVDYEFTALDRVAQLKPARFNFITDVDNTVDGFIAHEVQDIVPEAITGEKDAVREEEYEITPAVLDDDGNVVTEAEMGTREVPDYQGIDQSKLVPLLTKAIQEQQTLIDSLLARVEQLEN